MTCMNNLILFNKPFRVLSQFTSTADKRNLSEFDLPSGFYAAGRLDWDSEGLLLLTSDGQLQAQISHPRYKLAKTYWAQVEGIPDQQALEQLSKGIILNDGKTRPASARLIEAPALWSRTPPIRERKNIPTSWIALTITEGRNRQVRRMTAAVGFPTLRLVRAQIGQWKLGHLEPGKWLSIRADLPKAVAHRKTSVPGRGNPDSWRNAKHQHPT